jgi:hypothetical protein
LSIRQRFPWLYWVRIRGVGDLVLAADPVLRGYLPPGATSGRSEGPLDDLPDRVAVFGVFVYLIVQSAGMAGRDGTEVKAS